MLQISLFLGKGTRNQGTQIIRKLLMSRNISIYGNDTLFCQAGGREFESRRSRTEKALVSRREIEAFSSL